MSYIGTFSNNATNYTSGMRISYASAVRLFFPTAGYRGYSTGTLLERGYAGMYQTSTNDNSNNSLALSMYFANGTGHTTFNNNRAQGAPVKCIKI